jgi:spermidine synthase
VNIFHEALYRDHGQTLAVESVLHQGRTAHQDVLVFENPTFGRVLVLDGVVQVTERDNHIYHEMIAHVPMMAHGAPHDVLIVGGGDGGALRQVLKHPIATAVLVELDPDVIELSRRYFPAISNGAFDDARATVVVGDGAAYMAQAESSFDVIIVDSTDPVGPGEVLFSDAFYRDCRAALRPGGIIAIQSGAPFYQPRLLDDALAHLRQGFGAARAFLAPVPTYAHGLLALMIAGADDRFCPPVELLRPRMALLGDGPRYYSPEVHHAAFAMAPRFTEEPRAEASPFNTAHSDLPEWITRPARARKAPVVAE